MHVVNIQEVVELHEADPNAYATSWMKPLVLPYPDLVLVFTSPYDSGTSVVRLQETQDDWHKITVYQGSLAMQSVEFYAQDDREDNFPYRNFWVEQAVLQSFARKGHEPASIKEDLADMASWLIRLSLMAVKLMHVKNVTLEDYDPNEHISRQVKRARDRKNLGPLIKYKILHIKPYGRRPRNPATGNKTGIKQAVHTTRGHFKTFTPDKPAFGKPWGVGTFWVGPFVSGNPEFGLVMKDYHIEIDESDLKSPP